LLGASTINNKAARYYIHMAEWALVLCIFWLLLSGFLEPLLLSFGLVSVIIVLYVLQRMDSVDKEKQETGTGFQLIRYFPWLFVQIVKSSIQVTKLIWGSSEKLSPVLEKISAQDVPIKSRVLYANSITLTPGTLSVDLEGGEVTVHALQKSSIDELKKGQMENKITGLWGKNK
jgi:multicomponent Na+:H+ antiporter subunit E